jgi:hypothetical protein
VLLANEESLIEELETVKDECEKLKAREKNLVADMKKRGDAARTLIISKDEEIHKLKSKLSEVSSSHFEIARHSESTSEVADTKVESINSDSLKTAESTIAPTNPLLNEEKLDVSNQHILHIISFLRDTM